MQTNNYNYFCNLPVELIGIISQITKIPTSVALVSRRFCVASELGNSYLISDILKKINTEISSRTNLDLVKRIELKRGTPNFSHSQAVKYLFSSYENIIGKEGTKSICDKNKGDLYSIIIESALKVRDLDSENDENLMRIWPILKEEIKQCTSTSGKNFPQMLSKKDENIIKTADEIRLWLEENSFKLFHISTLSLNGINITSIPLEIVTKLPRLRQLNLFNMKHSRHISPREIQRKFQNAGKCINIVVT